MKNTMTSISRKAVLLTLLLTMACTPSGTQTPADDATDTPSGATETPAPVIETLPIHVGYGARGPWFEIYFTDPTNPAASQESGGIETPLIAAIDSAKLSVDVAIYSLSLRELGNALLRARDRGVQVRIVMESDNRDRTVPVALIEAGLPILGDRREGLMHDKFVVIDRSEVWTGSLNFTTTGTYNDNNNLVRIRSIKVAEDYTKEFEEMFVDDKFGGDIVPETPNPVVTIDGVRVEVYFSPDDGAAQPVRELLEGATDSIYFLAYSFTADELAEAIHARAAEGVTVAGVMEAAQVQSNEGTEYDAFVQAGLDVRLDGNDGQMHHKVIIIDDSIVVTGSYNFTASAENRNDENIVIFFSPEIAALYMEEFERVFAQAQKP